MCSAANETNIELEKLEGEITHRFRIGCVHAINKVGPHAVHPVGCVH